ncbi:EAL domain-containing protein, partial [Novosphingobium subterraneum]|uniref:EAL domain-containing protein n=1 Tax=Novosphingobium subterraneum TaxID=48936 RepID=UPI0012E0B802
QIHITQIQSLTKQCSTPVPTSLSNLGLAEALGMETLAEGVETQALMEILRSEGCDMIQGYLIGRPMPGNHVQRMLSSAQTTVALG